ALGDGVPLSRLRLDRRCVVARGAQLATDIVVVRVLARDRVLELAHPAPQRAAHLREALRSEDEERDEQEDEDLGEPDAERHAVSVAPATLRLLPLPVG